MSSCCNSPATCAGTNRFFSKWSTRYAKRFRKGKLEKVQRYLLKGVMLHPLAGKTILDVGCGVGALHLTLLKEGATKSLGIDLAEGMLEKAKHFADDMGFRDQAEYRLGDFVQLADSIEQSDITTLDKVVCCYENLDGLIDMSTKKTRSVLALSHPADSLPVKILFKTQILLAKLFKWEFRPFWHDWSLMRSMILARGFDLVYQNSTVAWQVVVFKRI